MKIDQSNGCINHTMYMRSAFVFVHLRIINWKKEKREVSFGFNEHESRGEDASSCVYLASRSLSLDSISKENLSKADMHTFICEGREREMDRAINLDTLTDK